VTQCATAKRSGRRCFSSAGISTAAAVRQLSGAVVVGEDSEASREEEDGCGGNVKWRKGFAGGEEVFIPTDLT